MFFVFDFLSIEITHQIHFFMDMKKPNQVKNNDYTVRMSILTVKTREAHTIKVLLETMKRYIKDGCFTFDEHGISSQAIDSNEKMSVYINVALYKNKFSTFKLTKPSFLLGTNVTHFYVNLKSIKKKDSLAFKVDEAEEKKLKIIIGQNGERNPVSKLAIINVTPVVMDEMPEYKSPITTTGKQFQQLKTLNKISKEIRVSSNKKFITFHSKKENLHERSIPLGDTSDDSDDADEEEEPYYCQKFDSGKILGLVKLAGLSPTVQIYAEPSLPLRIDMSVGSLGIITFWIKSEERLEEERKEKERESQNHSVTSLSS